LSIVLIQTATEATHWKSIKTHTEQ